MFVNVLLVVVSELMLLIVCPFGESLKVWAPLSAELVAVVVSAITVTTVLYGPLAAVYAGPEMTVQVPPLQAVPLLAKVKVSVPVPSDPGVITHEADV